MRSARNQRFNAITDKKEKNRGNTCYLFASRKLDFVTINWVLGGDPHELASPTSLGITHTKGVVQNYRGFTGKPGSFGYVDSKEEQSERGAYRRHDGPHPWHPGSIER